MYIVKQGHKVFSLIGNNKGKEFDADEISKPFLSHDGKQVAYVAYRWSGGDKFFVVVGDRKSKEYDRILFPILFSPDGTQVAYRAEKLRKTSGITLLGRRGVDFLEELILGKRKKVFIVVGNKEYEGVDYIETPIFSPDGKKLAFGAKRGRNLLWKVLTTETYKSSPSADYQSPLLHALGIAIITGILFFLLRKYGKS